MSDIKEDCQPNLQVKRKRGRPKIIPDKVEYFKQHYQKNKDNYKQKYEDNKEEVKEYNKTKQEKYRRCYQILKQMISKDEIPSRYKDEVNLLLT